MTRRILLASLRGNYPLYGRPSLKFNIERLRRRGVIARMIRQFRTTSLRHFLNRANCSSGQRRTFHCIHFCTHRQYRLRKGDSERGTTFCAAIYTRADADGIFSNDWGADPTDRALLTFVFHYEFLPISTRDTACPFTRPFYIFLRSSDEGTTLACPRRDSPSRTSKTVRRVRQGLVEYRAKLLRY